MRRCNCKWHSGILMLMGLKDVFDGTHWIKAITDKPLITHTPRWKEKSMGYHYVWVFGGGAYFGASGPVVKISAKIREDGLNYCSNS